MVYREASCHSVHPSHCMYTFHENITGYITNFNKPHMSVFQPVSLFLCLSVRLPASMFYLSVYLCLFIYLLVSPPASLSVSCHLSIWDVNPQVYYYHYYYLWHTHTHTGTNDTRTLYQYLRSADSLQTELNKWIKLVWTLLKQTLADLDGTNRHTSTNNARTHAYRQSRYTRLITPPAYLTD